MAKCVPSPRTASYWARLSFIEVLQSAWVALVGDPLPRAVALLDDGEPIRLADDPVDQRVLVVDRDGEMRSVAADRLVLGAAQLHRGPAVGVGCSRRRSSSPRGSTSGRRRTDPTRR